MELLYQNRVNRRAAAEKSVLLRDLKERMIQFLVSVEDCGDNISRKRFLVNLIGNATQLTNTKLRIKRLLIKSTQSTPPWPTSIKSPNRQATIEQTENTRIHLGILHDVPRRKQNRYSILHRVSSVLHQMFQSIKPYRYQMHKQYASRCKPCFLEPVLSD